MYSEYSEYPDTTAKAFPETICDDSRMYHTVPECEGVQRFKEMTTTTTAAAAADNIYEALD